MRRGSGALRTIFDVDVVTPSSCVTIQHGIPTGGLEGLLLDRAGLEEVGEIGGVDRVAEQRLYVEDLLHRLQVGRVRQVDRASIRDAVLVLVSVLRDDDLGHRVVEGIGVVAGHAVGLGLVPPEDDDAVVLVSLRRHDDGNNLGEEVVALGRIEGKTRKAAVPVNVPFAHVWTVREGFLQRLRAFTDTALLAEALGKS